MTRLGKSRVIDEALLDDSVDTPYKNRRIFPCWRCCTRGTIRPTLSLDPPVS